MKTFKSPMMNVVQLTKEDIVRTSIGCVENYCEGFKCSDCADCTGIFSCDYYLCPNYTS